MSRSRLAELQERFYALVTAPEGVGKTLAAAGLDATAAEALVKGDDRLGAVDRLDVYANMYFFRLLEVLADAYPKVAAALGETAFHNLITGYLEACRPRHPSIAMAGDRLPEFLAGHPYGAEKPWLVPLARLDRAYAEVFDGPDGETLTLDDVRALPPEQVATLPLKLIPCHRLLLHPIAVDPLWRALEEGEDGEPGEGPEVLLVWRQDIAVYHRAVEGDEGELLALAAEGTSLQRLCDHVAAPSTEEAAQQVFHLLARWLSDGLVLRP
jgi:hypothetical protein